MNRNLRAIALSSEDLLSMFCQRTLLRFKHIPKDAVVVNVAFDSLSACWLITIRHESFPYRRLDERIPVETQEFETINPRTPEGLLKLFELLFPVDQERFLKLVRKS